MRFGDLRMTTADDTKSKDPAAEAADKAKAKSNDKNVQRYMFAMARFNEDAVKKPELAELPALPEGVDEKAIAADEKTEENKDAKATDDSAKSDEAKSDKKDDAKSDEKSEATPAAEEKAGDEKSEEVKKIIAERKRIEAENQQKLDDYQKKLDKGRQTVKDLNLRFGDWYFVVSNDVFKKIRLASDDVIKKKDKGEPADAAGKKSAAGLPGQMIPGLPNIPGAGR